MGDDSTPRRVQSGSVFRGHTAEDASDLSDTAPLMYRVTSSNEARSTWTCNGDHILVLQFNDPPSAVDVETRRDHVRTFCFRTFALAEDGEVVHKAFEFSTRAEAEQAHERAVAAWRPLVWECTVNQFLVCSDAVKASATMFQPDLVHFPAPSHTLLKRLSAAIETRPEQLPSSLLKLTGSYNHASFEPSWLLLPVRLNQTQFARVRVLCVRSLFDSLGARCVVGRRLGGCAAIGQDRRGPQSRRAHPPTGRVVRGRRECQSRPCSGNGRRGTAREGPLGQAWTGV